MNPQSLLRLIEKNVLAYSKRSINPSFDRKRPVVRLHEPTYGGEEIWAALECLLSTQVTMGKKVGKFEQDLCRAFSARNSVVVNSGSSANLLAVAALANPAWGRRLRPGDEVIVPALCWSTTVWPLIQHGLVPVIVDVDPHTLNIDLDQIERAMSKKTRAIMPVHVYGNPCDMTGLMGLAKRRSLLVIEDCCEALGASYKGRSVGMFGEVGTFSFYYSHHITTLEGGVCVTNNNELAELMRILRAHGWVRETRGREAYVRKYPKIDPKFLFVNLGYNLRITELQGAMGSLQLKKLPGFLNIRKSNADYWRKELGRLGFFDIQQETPGGRHAWFGFPMKVKQRAPFTTTELRQHFKNNGIETRPIICGNIAVQPAMKYFKHRVVGDLRHSNDVMKNGFTFGNHQAIGRDARAYVAEVVRAFVKKY